MIRPNFSRFRGRRFSLLWAAVLAGLLDGCLHVYTGQNYTVTVRDGDTGRPVPNARVQLGYFHSEMDINNPSDAPSGVTDVRGNAVVAGTTFAHFWSVAVDNTYLGNGTWKEPDPVTSTPTAVQLKVYRLPKPTLTLIVPDGFHGPVLINPRGPGEPLEFNPGQRQFTLLVPPTGRVVFKAPGIFHAGFGDRELATDAVDDFSVRFIGKDGREIPQVSASFVGDHLVAVPAKAPVGRAAFDAMNFEANIHFSTDRPVWVIGGTDDAEAVARLLYIAHQNGLGREFNYHALDVMFNSQDLGTARAQK